MQYRKDSQIVERIEVFCHLEKSFCSNFVDSLHLPMTDNDFEAQDLHNSDRDLDYYRAPYNIVLTRLKRNLHEEGLERIALYSPELYAAAIASPSIQRFAKDSIKQSKGGGPATTSRNGSGTTEVKTTDLPGYMRGPAGSSSTTTNRSAPNQPSAIPSCFAGNPAIASTDRSAHYAWARQQSMESLDSHLKDKLDLLFRCSSLNDDWLAQVFADLSLYIANHAPNVNCFNGDAGVLDRGESAHYNWAKTKSREEMLKNLQWKMSAALRCLDRDAQLNLYADASVTIAYSGVERKHVRNYPPRTFVQASLS